MNAPQTATTPATEFCKTNVEKTSATTAPFPCSSPSNSHKTTTASSDEKIKVNILRADVAVVHFPCADGIAAKLLLKDRFGSHFPVKHYTHGATTVDSSWVEGFKNQNVLCIAWCPTLEGIMLLSQVAKTVTVLDHHKTSEKTAELSLPKNVTVQIKSPAPCASVQLWQLLLSKDIPVPEWLKVIDLHDTGRFSDMTTSDRSAHAALTDDLDALDGLRSHNWNELVERGRFLIETQRPLVAAGLIAKSESKNWVVRDKVYRVAYVELPHEKFISAIQETFWKSHPDDVDILALRMPLKFQLRRPPTSTLDLSALASLFADGGGHPAAAAIQLQHSPRFLPDLESS